MVLLIKAGQEFTENIRSVNKYKFLFDNVNFDFNNKVAVNVQCTPEVL
jgi:hypothetical protein